MSTFLEYIAGKDVPPNTSVLEPGGDTRGYSINEALQVAPSQMESPFPEAGGLIGGIGGALLSKNPAGARVGATAGQALMRTLIPSLAGSTVGTGAGLVAEGLLSGGMTPERATSALAQNALWDVGGNLVFSALGKTYRIGKDALGFNPASALNDPQVAAQRFLSERGATLSRGQLTGSALDKGIEEVARGGSGSSIFKEQEKLVREAIDKGVNEFKEKLGTSEAFNMALKQGDPTQMALGDNFKSAITVARDEFKTVHRPFYEKLSQDTGAVVDMRSIKAQAQQEYDRLAQGKFAGAGADKKAVLEDVLKQDDFVDFGIAHDIRSNFGAAARDATEAGGKTTTKSAGFTRYESGISKAMDDAFKVVGSTKKRVEGQGLPFTQTPAESTVAQTTGTPGFNPYLKTTAETKDLVREYRLTQESYKKGMDGLYNNTLTKALDLEPEAVGKYLFDPEYASRFRDVSKAVAQVDKYAKQDIINGLKYGFITQAMSNPDNVAQLAKTLETNKAFKEGFDYLFKATGEKEFLSNVLNAAKYGLDEGALSQLARDRVALEGTRVLAQGGALAGGYFLLPEDTKNRISDQLPQALATAGVLILTPRLVAKAMTNKQAMDALIDLSKAQSNPKFGGAAAAKITSNLIESGIIDNEYLTEINNKLSISPPNQPQQNTAPATNQQNFMDYLNK
jgi:hypothetical protein